MFFGMTILAFVIAVIVAAFGAVCVVYGVYYQVAEAGSSMDGFLFILPGVFITLVPVILILMRYFEYLGV